MLLSLALPNRRPWCLFLWCIIISKGVRPLGQTLQPSKLVKIMRQPAIRARANYGRRTTQTNSTWMPRLCACLIKDNNYRHGKNRATSPSILGGALISPMHWNKQDLAGKNFETATTFDSTCEREKKHLIQHPFKPHCRCAFLFNCTAPVI